MDHFLNDDFQPFRKMTVKSILVDRSAAYAARWVAKSLVKNGLCKRVLVQVSHFIKWFKINSFFKVSYAIGVAEPMSIFVDSYGTASLSNEQLTDIVKHNFDLRPGAIVK